MKPRSLLVRDRSQIGAFVISQQPAGHLGSMGCASRSSYPGSVATSISSAPSVATASTGGDNINYPKQPQSYTTPTPTPPSISIVKEEDNTQWKQSHSKLQEFVASLLGGSMGAYMVLFTGGSHRWLMLLLILPFLFSEIMEYYHLNKKGSSSSNKNNMKELPAWKKTLQLRYGQGLFMSAGLAEVLSATDPRDLMGLHTTHIWHWCVAWGIWTYLFNGNDDDHDYEATAPEIRRSSTSSSNSTSISSNSNSNSSRRISRISRSKFTKASKGKAGFKRRLPPRSLTA